MQHLKRAALAAALVGAAGVVAAPGNAATKDFKQPKLKNGVLTVQGTDGNDTIALRLAPGDPGVLQVDVGDDGTPDFLFVRANVAQIDVNAGDGDDTVRIDDSGGVFTDTIPTTISGGAGNDTLTGGGGAETFRGGAGDDTVVGGRGNDVAELGAGDDSFPWNPGDGSDTVDGGGGTDTMTFNGANVNEHIELEASGNRLELTRDVANITMDTSGLEQVDLNARGGADTVVVGDVSKTALDTLNVDLGSNGAGDGAVDQVIVSGTNHKDTIAVTGANGAAAVTGLPETVNIVNAEPANDLLNVNALDGADNVDASALQPSVFEILTVDGGDGNNTIAGSQGNDRLVGGAGNDTVDGNQGADLALLGGGNDTFVWDPGDGSDVVEGQDGSDTMRFNGSNVGESFDLSANGTRLRLFRNVGNITMDTNQVEQVDLNTLGGADTVVENDLSGTGVAKVNVDLAATGGGGDGEADQVVVNGTANPDTIAVSGRNGSAKVTGLAATVSIANAEPDNDTLTVNGLAGADTVDASGLAATSVKLVVNGGDDADTLVGSAGNDLVNGGRGNDTALLGSGDDTFVWNPGDGSDTVEGQQGPTRCSSTART